MNTGAEVYIDNVLRADDTVADSTSNQSPERSGHIELGRFHDQVLVWGKVTVDWLTIWDRVLTQEERDLLHLE